MAHWKGPRRRSLRKDDLLRVLLVLALLLAGTGPTRAEDQVIREDDGTLIVIKEDGSIIMIGQPGDEPSFGQIEGGAPPEPEPEPVPEADDGDCDPSTFKRNGGSTFFFLVHCPSAAGWAAKDRVAGAIDDAWLFVSDRFGSYYGASKLDAYIYTDGSHFHSQSGAASWSGGYYSPGKDEVHVPAPPGREGFDLSSLLVHELTHFRLEQLTYNEALGGGAIRYYRFLNEGIAQHMEGRLFEAERPEGARDLRLHKLGVLARVFDQGGHLMEYASMQRGVVGGPQFYYAQSWATVAYLEAERGEAALDALLTGMGTMARPRTRDDLVRALDGLFSSQLGMDAATLRTRVEEWARARIAALRASR